MDKEASKKIVPIGEAAKILKVSIDTVRRWDKEGKLHSERREGRTRYFSVEELEKVRFSKPMSISEAAKKLGLSASTLIRLEKKGLIKPRRNKKGDRIYDHEALEEFIKSEYFLKQKEVQDKILEPLNGQNGEVEKELESQKNQAIIKELSAPSLFDWFVAILAIFLGVSFFLFPRYSLDLSLFTFADLRMITKLALIPSGIALIGIDILRIKRKPFHTAVHVVLLLIFGLLGYMDYMSGFLLRALGEISISILLLITLSLKLESKTRFLIFLNLLVISSGFLIVKSPQSIAFSLVSDWIENNNILFLLLWYTTSLIVLLTSLYSARVSSKLGYFPFFTAGLGAFAYALLNLGIGSWHDILYATAFGSFAFIFPFENAFSSLTRYSKKESIGLFVFLTLILFIGIFFIAYFQQHFKGNALYENGREIKVASAMVESFVDEAEKEVSSFAGRRELLTLMSEASRDSEALDELISEFYFSSNTLRRIVLLDENAKGLSIYPKDDNFKGIDLFRRDYFHKAKKTKKIVISNAIAPSVPGVKAAVVIAAPLYDEDGDFLGVLGGSIDFVKLLSQLNNLNHGQSEYFVIADSEKNIILHPEAEALLTKAPSESPLSKAVEGKSGSLEEFNLSGELSLQNYAPVKSLGWGIVVEEPLKELLRKNGVISFLAFSTTIILGISSVLSIVYLKKK